MWLTAVRPVSTQQIGAKADRNTVCPIPGNFLNSTCCGLNPFRIAKRAPNHIGQQLQPALVGRGLCISECLAGRTQHERRRKGKHVINQRPVGSCHLGIDRAIAVDGRHSLMPHLILERQRFRVLLQQSI